ncbi:hypothetical protein MNAN1_003471 [Malassezia nana]|uniref:Uncharacterized protein n=1 Tax=Malassezia nana TaxID=180528 RepID=A0AAF0EPU9_9BASI|nr:hypothetical protein MNAN1_003471 [Malassezia nana]
MFRFFVLSALVSFAAAVTAAPTSVNCRTSGSPVVALAYRPADASRGYQIVPSTKDMPGKHTTKHGNVIMTFAMHFTKNPAVEHYWSDKKEYQFVPYQCSAATSDAILAGGWTEFRHATNETECLTLNGEPRLVPHNETATNNNLMTLKPCSSRVDSSTLQRQAFTAPTGKVAQKNPDNTLARGGVVFKDQMAYFTTDSSGSLDVYDLIMKSP